MKIEIMLLTFDTFMKIHVSTNDTFMKIEIMLLTFDTFMKIEIMMLTLLVNF